MHWTVATPFITKTQKPVWLLPYVPGERHKFQVIPRTGEMMNWHLRKSPVTERKEWQEYWQQSKEALTQTQGGVITAHPQLAATVGLQKLYRGRSAPVVSWFFNTATCYSGMKQLLASISLNQINKLIVHNSCEREIYSKWLGLPIERFEFVPLHIELEVEPCPEESEKPYIFATGSGFRDYATLFKAVEKLNLRTIIVPGKNSLKGLEVPPQVETIYQLPKNEIRRLVQRARVNVVPMTTEGIVAGTVTIAETMRLGRTMVITNRSGVEDYVQDGVTGLMVKPFSVDEMVEAIDRLWNDSQLRLKMNEQADKFAFNNFTVEAVGASMGRILDQVADELGVY